ncbi:MAG: beta-propeller fold lactonase family protein [Acidimicrobiaceae bacterium]|nr:beta-propeller fold lactonase family protein [Acidimicrobiaceae bacterium]
MKLRIGVGATAVALAAFTAASGGFTSVASAHPGPGHPVPGDDHAVFIQTDNPAGNQVVAYDRAPNGTLRFEATYDTGGLGGVLNGSAVDHLASQGSLAFDQQRNLLYAVNAGSNTISVFFVRGDDLRLLQVISSGGTFPVSIATHDGLVYVLNALSGGSVQGYFSFFGHLVPIPGSDRSLGLTIPTDTTQFTNTPGQVAFSPDGAQLIVTTKLNLSDIDVFRIGFFGSLSPSPVVNPEPGTGPFGVTFDAAGHLVVADTANNAVATYALNRGGTVTLVDSVPTGQAATCWVAAGQSFFYASNAGSSNVSGYAETSSGILTLLAPPTPTDPGTVDAASAGQFLYVQSGASGIVDEYQINGNGSLTRIGSVPVAGAAGGEGIVAT